MRPDPDAVRWLHTGFRETYEGPSWGTTAAPVLFTGAGKNGRVRPVALPVCPMKCGAAAPPVFPGGGKPRLRPDVVRLLFTGSRVPDERPSCGATAAPCFPGAGNCRFRLDLVRWLSTGLREGSSLRPFRRIGRHSSGRHVQSLNLACRGTPDTTRRDASPDRIQNSQSCLSHPTPPMSGPSFRTTIRPWSPSWPRSTRTSV